ncbi:MAG: PQQ-binding-like beta-propeller repeat protein [Acidobacteria bacterium]|nr:PQQ-binding-like beta-propeller repeat protein [Acidobacteriota bacterium]
MPSPASRAYLVCLVAAVLLAASAFPAGAQDRDFTPVSDAVLQDPDPADWLNWRRTLDGWGYSPLDQVDQDNVGDLRLVWSWGLEPGVSQTTPIVHDGVMYIANPGNVVQALDAGTGDFIWEYRREMDERLRPAAQMRSLAIYEDLIILNTRDAHVVGLDARTGEERWDTDVAPDHDGYGFSSGPVIADGTVVAGLRGCERFREDTCYIVGVDGRTGRLMWRTSTIARPGERGGDTWGDLPLLFRAGSDAWIPGAYDPVTRLVYYGTAQAKPWSRDARGTDGDALYSNSTLALDPETGEMRWFFQHIPGDSHDMDETFERILIDYDGRQSVFSMGKLGILWELDRTTGAFTKAVDLGYQNLADIDPETGEFTYREGMVSGVGEMLFFCPSTGGFKALRAMAYHPDTGALYVPLNLQCETAAFGPVEQRPGGGGTGGVRGRLNHFHPDAPGQLGEFQALDIRTGEALWKHRLRVPYNTAALTTGGGLVFVGDWERHVFAYDAASGEQLWQSRLTTMANGYPITYAVDGRQYIAFGAGGPLGGSSWTSIIPADLIPEKRNPRQGNGIFVFALPEED